MILENFNKFIRYFGQKKKFELSVFVIMSVIAGLLEFLGIALIYPFILMIISPDVVTSQPFYLHFVKLTGLTESLSNALILGCLALLMFIIKNLYMIFFLRVQSRIIVNWKQDILCMFMQYFLFASYKDIIKTSNSDKLYILNTLCQQVLGNFVFRGVILLTNFLIVAMVISLILFKFPIAGCITILFAVFSMFVQNKYLKKVTASINEKIQPESRILNMLTCSNIENMKEIKIIGAEDKFYNEYLEHSNALYVLESDRDFYAGIPPYVIEMLVVFSLLIMGAFIAAANLQDRSVMVASFAVVVASIFRIAPALNRIQTSIININTARSYLKALNSFYETFNLLDFKPVLNVKKAPFSFKHKIELKNISFSYVKDKPVLKNISLEIEKGDFIGIIGLSGSGKTTLADVLMGLLPPDSGEILVDGVKLTNENYHNFRSIIGYVPQEVKVFEKSFKENIAWGSVTEEIDDVKVKHAIEAARLSDYVKQFSQGIEATPFVGSTGASQGQKQRLALARVLYRNPEIIILDEATASLDVKVEHEITGMLGALGQNKTLIAIAHRLSTLKSCNKLIYIKDGELVDTGTFQELSSKYEDFNLLLKLSSIN